MDRRGVPSRSGELAGPYRWYLRLERDSRWVRPNVRELAAASLRSAAVIVVTALYACQSVTTAADQALGQGLQVAEVALAAQQPDVARKLYQSLAERYPDAPAPRLNLAHIAFGSGDFVAAREHFLAVAEMPAAAAIRGEAWFGAGRAALSLKDAKDAKAHFLSAREIADSTADAAWIANGLAIAATLEGDLASANAHYADALALAPQNPRIMANYVRMLTESGQVEQAAQIYTEQAPSFWSDDDERTLRLLIRESWQD